VSGNRNRRTIPAIASGGGDVDWLLAVRTQSHSRERPSVTVLPTGRASGGVRVSRQASSTSAITRDTQLTAADKARTRAERPGRSATSSSSCARLVATKASSTRAENVSSDRRSCSRPARSLRITRSRSAAEGRFRTELGVSRFTTRIFPLPLGCVHKSPNRSTEDPPIGTPTRLRSNSSSTVRSGRSPWLSGSPLERSEELAEAPREESE
jgi:hypothetical protein